MCKKPVTSVPPAVQKTIDQYAEGETIHELEMQRVFYHLESPCVLTVLDCAMKAYRAAAKRRSRLPKGA